LTEKTRRVRGWHGAAKSAETARSVCLKRRELPGRASRGATQCAAHRDVSIRRARSGHNLVMSASGPGRVKTMTSGAKAAGRFGKQDFVYVAAEDVYRCPAGETLIYRYASEEDGKTLRRYWTTACKTWPLKAKCT